MEQEYTTIVASSFEDWGDLDRVLGQQKSTVLGLWGRCVDGTRSGVEAGGVNKDQPINPANPARGNRRYSVAGSLVAILVAKYTYNQVEPSPRPTLNFIRSE
jgi:hypothetical protein